VSTDAEGVDATVGLSAFQRDVLFVVAREAPCKGVTAMGGVERAQGRSVNHGQIYQALDRLAEVGLVEKGQHPDDGRTNAYTLTEAGRRAVEQRAAWVRDAVDGDGGEQA